MEQRNKILLIEPEEAIRLGAKAFLAAEGIFIDTAPTIAGKDLSAYRLVIEAGEKEAGCLGRIFLQKPYTAGELYQVIINRNQNPPHGNF